MAQTYKTRAGDVLDQILWTIRGEQIDGDVERTYEANPGLAEHGPELPSGLLITIPDLPADPVVVTLNLWT